MKMKKRLLAAAVSLTLAATAVLTGCGQQKAAEGGSEAGAGTLILSVNPEIEIGYDGEGKVLTLDGRNDDGDQIVGTYPDYIGKECDIVLEDLIGAIYEEGYFADEIDGNSRNIVLQLVPGSALPEDDFLTRMSERTQNAVKNLNFSSGIVMIDDDDYDPEYAKNGAYSPYITLEKAKEIALKQAGVSASDAVFEEKEFDFDDGTPVFELEFSAGGNHYEYDVDARTGKVIRGEHETAAVQPSGTVQTASASAGSGSYGNTDYGAGSDGVTDYGNTDYGAGSDGVTDYGNTDYGAGSDGVTDYGNTDYGAGSDGVTDYGNTDYGAASDGVTDYGNTDYGAASDGVTDYSSSGDSGYDDGGSSDYDSGASDYDD